jgi:hypothetical protein
MMRYPAGHAARSSWSASSFTHAPSRSSPPGSIAGRHAVSGWWRIAWWTASVDRVAGREADRAAIGGERVGRGPGLRANEDVAA